MVNYQSYEKGVMPLRLWNWLKIVIPGAMIPLVMVVLSNRFGDVRGNITEFFGRGEGYIIGAATAFAAYAELEIGHRKGEAFPPLVWPMRSLAGAAAFGTALLYATLPLAAKKTHADCDLCIRALLGTMIIILVTVWVADPKREIGKKPPTEPVATMGSNNLPPGGA